MEKQPMMKCGHRANATNNGKPCCVICAGFNDKWKEIVEEPDLTNRKCRCEYCKKIVPSLNAVAFYEHRPNEEYDTHYDGCFGWD